MSLVPKGVCLKDRHKYIVIHSLKAVMVFCAAKWWGADSRRCLGTTWQQQQQSSELVGLLLAWKSHRAGMGSTEFLGNPWGQIQQKLGLCMTPGAGLHGGLWHELPAPVGPAPGFPSSQPAKAEAHFWGGLSSSRLHAQVWGVRWAQQ